MVWAYKLTHIGKLSGMTQGIFQKKVFAISWPSGPDVTTDDNWEGSRGINITRVGAPRHDITANLLFYLKISNKIWISENSGYGTEEFPETISRYWKKFAEKPLSHDPFLGKNIFSWVSTHEIYLEIVSGKSPESRPKLQNLEKVSRISPESPPVIWK